MDERHLLGWGKLLKTVGATALLAGLWLDVSALAWGGAAALAVAFVASGLGKAVHYRTLPLSRRERLLLSGSWVALTVLLGGFLWVFLRARFAGGSGPQWHLAIAGAGAALVHYGFHLEYLGTADDEEEAEADASVDVS